MGNSTFILDRSGTSFGMLFQPDRILYDITSEYQKITVFESREFGRTLMLDDVFNLSTVMEAFYHEPMAHIPLAMSGGKENILIVGGGDFGVATHMLKHPDIERLTVCELDHMVIETCREYFPELAACERDSRLNIKVADGFDHIRTCPPQSLDAIIVDSTDPFLTASILVSEEFYKMAFAALKPGGVLMQILADFIFYQNVWFEVVPRVRKYFPKLAPLFVPIPFYATGVWGLMIAGREDAEIRPDRVSQDYLDGISKVKTLTPDLVKGWFSLPPFLKDVFGPLLKGL